MRNLYKEMRESVEKEDGFGNLQGREYKVLRVRARKAAASGKTEMRFMGAVGSLGRFCFEERDDTRAAKF